MHKNDDSPNIVSVADSKTIADLQQQLQALQKENLRLQEDLRENLRHQEVLRFLNDQASFEALVSQCESIEDRVVFFLNSRKSHHGYWEWVADNTGITSKRWRKVIGREQRVTSDMLQALCCWMPNYAFWLATGKLPSEEVEHSLPTFQESISQTISSGQEVTR